MLTKKFKKIKLAFFILFVLFFLFSDASLIFAQEINYPNLPGAQAPQNFLKTAVKEDLMGLWVKYMVNLAVWSAGLLAFLGLVAGGIRFLISSGDPEKITGAKKQVFGAFLGLIIILSSYTILNIISPFFLNFTLPKIEEIKKIPPLPKPPTQTYLKSAVDVYIPIGRVIENIFETYISKVPKQGEDPIPKDTLTRIQRIKNSLWATEQLLPGIIEKSEEIRGLSKKCSCYRYTKPDPRCTSCSRCFSIFCTGDPCSNVRGQIVTTQKGLLPYLFEGIEEIEQKDAYENLFKIKTYFVKEIEKTETEIRLLKEAFDKLGRAEQFIKDCNWGALNNANQYFQKKQKIEAEGGIAESVSFFNDINIFFNMPTVRKNPTERWYPSPNIPMEKVFDESVLYCALGGTAIDQPVYFEAKEIDPDQEPTDEKMEVYFSEQLSCPITIPFGEVLDKAHRITRLLINKLELIVDREKRILESIDQLQVLVSQCSSRLCFPFCACIPTPGGPPVCIEFGCFGPACFKSQISREMRRIRQYAQEIKDAINGVAPYDTEKKLGIIPLFDDMAVDLLDGMEKLVRNPMKNCGIQIKGASNSVFFSSKQAIGGTDAMGKMIKEWCIGTVDWRDTEYGSCLNNCYLNKALETKTGTKTNNFFASSYSYCLDQCLVKKSTSLKDPKILYCNHELRFQCCTMK